MDDAMTVTVGGLVIYSRPGLGPFVLAKDGMNGWIDGVAMAGDKVKRTRSHGSYGMPRYQDSRTVTLDGHILGTSKRQQTANGELISGLLADGEPGRIEVLRKGTLRWAECYLDGQTSVDERRGSFNSVFQLQVWCPEALRFGDRETIDFTPGQTVQVYHRGNTKSAPVIQFNGPLVGGATITHPSGQYTFIGNYGLGEYIRIDMSTGRLLLNGNDRSDLITRMDVHEVRPGPAVPFTFNRGSGYVEIHDAHI